MQNLDSHPQSNKVDETKLSTKQDSELLQRLRRGFSFAKGKGQPGRFLNPGRYDWCPNVQNLPDDKFVRLDVAKSAGIKIVFNVAVSGGLVELAITEEKAEDQSIVDAVKALF